MTDNLGLNNRVYQILSQNSQKAAVDILGMRISTKYKNKFTEIMITETEAFGTAKADEMSLANQLNRKIPISLPLGPPHVMVLKTYGSNNSLYFLTSKEGSCQAVLIRSGKVILGKNYVETRRKQKMKNDNIYGPGNITKALGIDIEQDGENLLDGSIALSTRIHPVDRAIAKQRKNSKPRDKHLWRFTLVL
jgi:3-methyladenine DNA glycosylase Mpg